MTIKVGETLEYRTTASVSITLPKDRTLVIGQDGACMLIGGNGTSRIYVHNLAKLIIESEEQNS